MRRHPIRPEASQAPAASPSAPRVPGRFGDAGNDLATAYRSRASGRSLPDEGPLRAGGEEMPVSPTVTIVLLWVGFAITHILMSSIRLRPALVRVLGDRGFLGVYSLVALGLFVPLCTVYFGNKHSGPLLWSLPMSTATHGVIQIAMGVAFVLLFAGLLTPSPTSMTAARDGAAVAGPAGVHFITRHAVFMATAIFGAVHLIPNGFASDVAFFGGFPVFVLIGSIHQDRRRLATDGEKYRPFYEATPLVPFTGRSTLRGLRELSWLAIGLGLGTTVLVRYFHSELFGG